jgi:hypothetical protein
MSRALLAEEIKRLLPGEENKRIRQAIMLAYGGAAGVARGVRNEIDQENRLRNGVLVVGTIDITSDTSATLADWAWVVDFAVQQSGEQTLAIEAPDPDFTRVDFFHGDNAGVIHYSPGVLDSDGNSMFPDIPEDHVVLRAVLRNPDSSNEEVPAPEEDSLITFIEDFIIPMTLDNKLVRSGLRKSGDRFVFEGRAAGLPAINPDEYVTLDQLPNIPQYGLIDGGQIQWAREGLKYNAAPVIYALNGPKSVGSRQVTLDPADPTLDRFDVIGWDINEEIFFITGTPGENPVIPSIDFATQVYGTAILVKAGSTSPEPELVIEDIYIENTEWAVSSTGTGTLAAGSTNNPIDGSVSVEVTNIQNGFTVRFTNDEDINLDDFETIGFLMRLKNTLFAGYSLSAIWLNSSAAAISNSIFLSPERENTDVQFLALSLSEWTFSSKLARSFQITFIRSRGGQIYTGFWLDNVKLEGGIQQPNPPSGGVSIHNQLQQIQGGNENERYHLTKSQWDAVEASNSPSDTNPFATMADVGGGGSSTPYLSDLVSWPNIPFDKNYRYIHEMSGAQAVNLISTGAIVGNFTKLYVKANGSNKLTFNGDYEIILDTYSNVAGHWNRYLLEWTPEGKAIIQITQLFQGTPNDGTGLTVLTVSFEDNFVRTHVIVNSTEIQIDSTNAEIGFRTLFYFQADGINKPFFGSDIVVNWDNYLNEAGVWNRFWLECTPENKVSCQILNT